MAVDTIARALAIKAQQGGGSGGTSDYQELTNKPSINGVVLEGNKTSSDLGIETGVTEEQLTQALAQESSARQKQDDLLQGEISDKMAPANVKAGIGIDIEQSGLDVTVSSVIYWDGTIDEDGNALAMFQEAYDYYLETGVIKNIQLKKVESNGEVNICPLININVSSVEAAFVFASLNGTPNTYTNPTLKYYNYRFNISDGTLSYRSTVSYDSFKFKVAHVYEGYNVAYGGCLEVDNNKSYIPTSDYNPATKKYVDDLVSTISTLSFQVVTELPTTDIQTNIIYLVPSTTSSGQNIYDEYIYINSTWEKIGSTSVDLSNYLSKDNTTAYTPTGDYNPATKQYVDSSVTNQATTEETISGLKTFTTLPESSVIPTTDNQLVNKAYVDDSIPFKVLPQLNNGQYWELADIGFGYFYSDRLDLRIYSAAGSSAVKYYYNAYLFIIDAGRYRYITIRYSSSNGIPAVAYGSSDSQRDWLDSWISPLTVISGINVLTLGEEQDISGLKTFTTLPESSVVPTTDNQLVNKQYVDSTLSVALGNINTILATLTTVSEVTE